MADETMRTFWAKSKDPSKVGVWDRHPDHPPSATSPEGGEVMVAGDQIVEVASTPLVMDALAKGMIVEVSGPAGRTPSDPQELPNPSEGKPAQAAVGGEAPADAARSGRK